MIPSNAVPRITIAAGGGGFFSTPLLVPGVCGEPTDASKSLLNSKKKPRSETISSFQSKSGF